MESPGISFGAYVVVENADLYQEILGGLTGIADLKLVGSSRGLPPDGSFHIDLFILGAAEEDGARRGRWRPCGARPNGVSPPLSWFCRKAPNG